MRKALVALSLLLPSLASAQAITFDEAISLSTRIPRVEGTERALEARRSGDADIGGTSQGLSIEATPGARILSEQDSGFEGSLSITHSWNLGDLTGARRRAARAEREVLDAERRALALLARLEAARRWIDLWRLEQLAGLLREEQALAGARAEATARAVGAGAQTSGDAAEVEAHVAAVELRAIALEGEQHEASIGLSVAMGRSPSATLRPDGSPPEPALPNDVDL